MAESGSRLAILILVIVVLTLLVAFGSASLALWLAGDWEEYAWGMTLTLKLEPNIATHDKAPTNGRLFNAEDMAYNLMRISGALDPANKARYQRAATLAGMDSAKAVDATTVQVKMAKPSSAVTMPSRTLIWLAWRWRKAA